MIFNRNLSKIRLLYTRNYSQKASELILRYLPETDEGITLFELNEPARKNSFGTQLVREFYENIKKVTNNSKTRVLIIRSLVPGIFSAGADLKERMSMPLDQVSKFVTNLQELMQKIHELQFPVIAAIDGVALGGGLELALACDLRICSTNSKLGLVESKLALIPGAGGTQRLSRLINVALAKELIYTGRIFNGIEAARLGVANHVVDQNKNGDAAYVESLKIAREIIPNGPLAVEMAKKSINDGVDIDLKQGLIVEQFCYSKLIPSKDRVEGLMAFNNKRKPIYHGK